MLGLPSLGGAEMVCELALAQEDKHTREAEEGQGLGEWVDKIFTYYL